MPPHDRLFKTILRAFFANLLWLATPGVAARAVLSKIAFLYKELLTQRNGAGSWRISWMRISP